jgi:hypothetical protein
MIKCQEMVRHTTDTTTYDTLRLEWSDWAHGSSQVSGQWTAATSALSPEMAQISVQMSLLSLLSPTLEFLRWLWIYETESPSWRLSRNASSTAGSCILQGSKWKRWVGKDGLLVLPNTLGAAHIDSRSTMLFGTVISEMLAILLCL